MKEFKFYNKVVILSAIFIFLPLVFVFAESKGDVVNFNVEEDFDNLYRYQVQAELVQISPSLLFYVEKNWWDKLSGSEKNKVLKDLSSLSNEFDDKIYPTLTSLFGNERRPGIDGSNKITILFHSMKIGIGGYFRSIDAYFKVQAPFSNEREMLYLPIASIGSPRLKTSLAHEFVHLITFNQKEVMRNVQEEIWLNEARAEYALSLMGYNDAYEGSNLQRRVGDFLRDPLGSLTEWRETRYDYAVVNMFIHYLVDHYGARILSDSMKSRLVGIPSINEALIKNGFKEDFAQIFADWTITALVNDCSKSVKYCYLNQNLKTLKINPTINFLPLAGNSSLSVTNTIKNWSGNWQKIIGGNGNLSLEFSGPSGLDFKVPYVVFDKNDNYSVGYMDIDENRKGKIEIENFGENYNSLIIIPSLHSKVIGFNGLEQPYLYNFTVSVENPDAGDSINSIEQDLIQSLLSQIEDLKKQIATLMQNNFSAASFNNSQNNISCSSVTSNLYIGLYGNEVRCLQEFLKNQGGGIYPEGLVTGYFGNLTAAAVIRFQEKYGSDILIPISLSRGTGYVGAMTRMKINQLLGS